MRIVSVTATDGTPLAAVESATLDALAKVAREGITPLELVDCGPDAEVCIGDEVVLIGSQGDDTIGVDEIATGTGTIAYEILTGIGSRVERRHRGPASGASGQVS